jgi:hypothetical protein
VTVRECVRACYHSGAERPAAQAFPPITAHQSTFNQPTNQASIFSSLRATQRPKKPKKDQKDDLTFHLNPLPYPQPRQESLNRYITTSDSPLTQSYLVLKLPLPKTWRVISVISSTTLSSSNSLLWHMEL